MPINPVLITNTIDQGRQIVNQISANINAFGAGGTLTSNLHINPIQRDGVALNLVSGILLGNGANIFGIDANNITINLFRNSQLENSSITITAVNGLNGGGVLALGSAAPINVIAVDSITNTRTNLAASANSIRWVESITAPLSQNASFVNTGILSVATGGLGVTSLPSGQVLIGNSLSGGLVANTIWAGGGMLIETGTGFVQFGANLIQGANVTFTRPSGGGLQISANTPPTGNSTQIGIVRLNDTLTAVNSQEAATANAVNALGIIISRQGTISSAPGRLLGIDVYKQPGVTHSWTRRTNTDYVIVTLIGAGGSGAGSPAFSATGYGLGGWSGSMLTAVIVSSNVGSTMNVVVGWGGNAGNSHGNTGVYFRGGNSSFSNSTFRYLANGGHGGSIFTTSSGPSMNSVQFANVSTPYPTANIPVIGNPRPHTWTMIRGEPPTPFTRLRQLGNVMPSRGGSVAGWSMGGQPIPSGSLVSITPHVPGPGGKTAIEAPSGDGFGGGGGGGGYNEGSSGNCSGGSGANGLCIIYSYSIF